MTTTNGLLFLNGLKTFIDFARSNKSFMDGDKIKCPCINCCNKAYQEVETAKLHLSKKGFMPNYHLWDRHGETSTGSTSFDTGLNDQHGPSYKEMVLDAAGPDFITRTLDEEPNPEDKKFFDMLKAADRELWSGCEKVTQLSVVARLLNIKSEYRIPEQCFDAICQLMKDGLPEDNNMVGGLYDTKKLIQALGLPVELIDCCRSGCMLYWKNDKDLDRCKFCKALRYKSSRSCSKRSLIPYSRMHYLPLTPRLKRLYASHVTAASMRWHAEDHGHDVGDMCHPSDSKAWKHFDIIHPSFAAESRNVRLGLCTDGFQPHGTSGKQYSSWPIIITPYNLPPFMCMKEPYMFLTAIVPGPKNPKHRLDVFLQPVIAELKQLWEEGVLTYDVSLKQNFQLRPASSTSTSSTHIATESIASETVEKHGYRLGSKRDGRLCIGIRANSLFPTNKCSTIIHSSFIERVDPNGYKWATLSTATTQFYWDEFQKNCYWDPSIDDDVKPAWEEKAKERYRQYIYNMSSMTRNPTRKKPTHVGLEIWTSWNTIWNTEEFKKRSEQNKRNRRNGVVDGRALPTHNGGSASYIKIADDMEKSLGCPPSTFDVFIYTHTKDHDGKTFIVDKAKQVHDKFESLRDELVATGEEVDDGNLFYEVVGGHDRKRRIYGLGSYGKYIVPASDSSETCTSLDPNAYKHEVNSKIQKLEEIVEQQQVFMKKTEERYEKQEERHRIEYEKQQEQYKQQQQQHEQTMSILQGLAKAFTNK